jgi:hypothetical protein
METFLLPGEMQKGGKNERAGAYLQKLVPPNPEQRSRAAEYGREFSDRVYKWTQNLGGKAPSVDGSEGSKDTALYKAFLQEIPPEMDSRGHLGDSRENCRIDPQSNDPINPPMIHNAQNREACAGRLLPGIKDGVCKKAVNAQNPWILRNADECEGRVLTFPSASLNRYSYAGKSLTTVLGEKVEENMHLQEHGESPWHADHATDSFHLEVWGAYKTFAVMDRDPQKQSFYINWILRLRLFGFLDTLQNLNDQQVYIWTSFLQALDGLVEASTSLEDLGQTELMASKIPPPKLHLASEYHYKVRDSRRWPPPSTTTRLRQQVLFCRTLKECMTELKGMDLGNVLVVETQWIPERLEGIMPDNQSRSLDLINFLQYFCTVHKTETDIFQGWWSSDSHILLHFFDAAPQTISNPSNLLDFLVAHVLRMASVSVFLVPLLRMNPQKRRIEHLMQVTVALETWRGRL